jgi:hypothetical protein
MIDLEKLYLSSSEGEACVAAVWVSRRVERAERERDMNVWSFALSSVVFFSCFFSNKKKSIELSPDKCPDWPNLESTPTFMFGIF